MPGFTKLVKNVDEVSVGEEVLLKIKSSLPGMTGKIQGKVKAKHTVDGKHYLDIEGYSGVKVPDKSRNPSFKVYRKPAAAAPAGAEGGRRKTRRSAKARSTRRRRA